MTFVWRWCCYGAILITISTSTLAYIFDVNNVIMYEDAAKQSVGSRDSYSGFSVSLWNPGHAEIDKSSIFIGAPRANSSAYPQFVETGTVFKCKIGGKCREWVVDTQRSKGPGNGTWLGGSMKIRDGPNPLVVVCGPRWLDLRQDGQNPNAWPMKGICYQTDADSNKKGVPMVAPYDSSYSLSDYVMGESGFSINIVPDSDWSIILGCPGLFHARGTPIQFNVVNKQFRIPTRNRNRVEQYDYSGYAVTSGYYFGRRYGRLYATGAPRSANLYGRVILFRFDGDNYVSTVDAGEQKKQVGEYFGSALATCDIDGDGNDDLIVGAPQWTKIVDEGRIYIFRGNDNEKFKEPQIFEGETARARFGTAITCLGDIDYDGYADVAVGAPYEGNGVLYIYHGSRNGLTFRPTQKIIGPKNTKGFGISISEPRDIDNNYHADIAVGAYLSGHTILFRSKRAVTTKVTLSTEKTLQTNATSFSITICSSYTGKHAPPTLTVTKELKVDEFLQRAEIEVDGGRGTYHYSDTLKFRSESCQNFTINLKKGIANFLADPLKLSVIQRLSTTDQNGTLLVQRDGTISGEEHFDPNSTVINEVYAVAKDYQTVAFVSKCGNNTCNSHLLIQMTANLKNGDSYVIGSGSYVELNITVTNTGDLAYLTKVELIIPALVYLGHIPLTCTQDLINNKTKVTCDIGNPLGTNEPRKVSLSLDVTSLASSNTTKIYLNATATTQSNDTFIGHNKTLPIHFVEETDIGITRKNTMDRYSYTLVGKEAQFPSIGFQHIYEIKNYEVTPIAEAVLSVSIPTHWIHAGNEIEIIRLDKIAGSLDGREIECTDAETDKNISSSSYDATAQTEWFNGSSESMRLGLKPDEKFTIIEGKVFASSADNRTLHINCTNPLVKWETINCKLTSFRSPQYVARLVLMFELLVSNFTSQIIGDKDIIFFVTNGSVRIVEPYVETIHKEPNLIMIGTMFVGSPSENQVHAWIIISSILVGLLLLILIMLALFKFGFFKRTKKMELRELLKEKDEATPETVPESTSRTETSDNM